MKKSNFAPAIAALIISIVLVSGCGIFRKSKRSESSIETVETSRNVNVSTDITAKEVSNVKDSTNYYSSSEGNTKVYPTKGSQVIINPDGTIITEADSVIQDVKVKTQAARIILQDMDKELTAKHDSTVKDTAKTIREEIVKTSEPKNIGFFEAWGQHMAIITVLFIIGIFVYIKFFRK